MRVTALLLSLAICVSASGDAVDEVRRAETGFAKAFADRDKAKFFEYVAPDAVFITALGTLRGREAVVARWSRFFDGVPDAPFSWGPERVEVTAGGTIGFSMGPIYEPGGAHAGYYSSIWQKQGDGSWKIVFDGPGNPPAPLPEHTAPFEEGFVGTPDGAKLHYRKIGRGPVTLIVPFGSTLYGPMSQFADIATVIAYDLRNRGRSSRVTNVNTLTINQDVADLETVRAHFEVERFVPVGFSYLGKMVVMYAAAHPQRVARVVQLGPVANRPVEPAGPADPGARPENLKRYQEMKANGGQGLTEREACEVEWGVMKYWLVGNPAHASRLESLCAFETEWPAALGSHFASLFPTVTEAVLGEADLKKVGMPVLTLHGTKDRNAPWAGGRDWASILPDARLVSVDGAAHALWADDPVTVFGAIRHFLRGEWPLGSVE